MDSSNARSFVVGLLIRCPFDTRAPGCCLHGIRGKNLKENMEIAKRLTGEEVQHILAVHKECFGRKES